MNKMVSDILWYNSSTGETQIWYMDGHKVAGRATVLGENGSATFIGLPWSIVGTNDFNQDGKADILWHNAATGETQIWSMEGHKVAGRATVLGENGSATFIALPWSIVGTNDFNQDGKADILWHNAATGETQIWYMEGHKVAGRATVLGENGSATFIGLPWSIVGTNDFNQDGKADILWHNAATGETQIWYMDGHKVAGRATVLGENGSATFVGLPWRIVGTNDFNQDGKVDIVWHNASSGETQIWSMDGRKVTSRATVLGENGSATFIGLPWSIVGTGEFNPLHSAIGDKYAQLGGPNSWLGRPTSDEQAFPQDGRVRTFEKGAIYWWPDTGAIELGNISLQYKGLYCFGETDELSSADEPYVIFGVVPAPPARASEAMTQIYTSVDAGDARPDTMELYRGLPYGAAVGVALMENDEDDPNKYLEQVKQGVALAGTGVTAACAAIPYVGAAVAIGCAELWKEFGPVIVESVNDLLGTADDLIEKWVWQVTAKEMVTSARAPRLNFWGIEYHLESKLLSDGEASYKVYLGIYAV